MAALRQFSALSAALRGASTRRFYSELAEHARKSATIQDDGLTLNDFISQTRLGGGHQQLTTAQTSSSSPSAPRVFIETYGCQMNVNDSEVVHSVLSQAGYVGAMSAHDADIVLINTCAIREHAESKVWKRLGYYKNMKAARKRDSKLAVWRHETQSPRANLKNGSQFVPPPRVNGPVVGVLGCMAERLKHRLLESDRMVDLVAGPDAYRDLPRLINIVQGGAVGEGGAPAGPGKAINVQLSADETYADVVPVRPAGAHSVFLSIMRGCNNMCAFCVVPFTRGRERSRPAASIVEEVKMLSQQGVKEVTLLGQNVNSYADWSETLSSTDNFQSPSTSSSTPTATASKADDAFAAHYAPGFRSVYRPARTGAISFAELLDRVAAIDPEMRVRFTSPHPKEFSDKVLDVVAARPNVCKQLHMPAQSGSSSVLNRMRRGYTREAYDELVAHVRRRLPGVALSTDMIAGFCGETEKDHQASVHLLRSIQYDQAFLFAYSEREKTHAARNHADDVLEEDKGRRLKELVEAFRSGLGALGAAEVGRRHLVLVEGPSRRNSEALTGRTDTGKRVVFDDVEVPGQYCTISAGNGVDSTEVQHAAVPAEARLQPGEYVAVQIIDGGTSTLKAVPLARTTLAEFVSVHGSAVPLDIFPPVEELTNNKDAATVAAVAAAG